MNEILSGGGGRGRGRGQGALLITPKSPAPEAAQRVANVEKGDEIITQLRTLPLEVSDDELTSLCDAVKTSVTTSDQLKLTATTLRRRCDDNWHLAPSAARLAGRLADLQVDGMKFRSCILTCINQEYKAFEAHGKVSGPKFLGFVAMLSQLFIHLLVRGGPPFVLVEPIMKVMSTLFDDEAIDTEMNCGATQLMAIGGQLRDLANEESKTRLAAVVENIRNKIIGSKGTQPTRLLMIAVMEAAASDWTIVNNISPS